MKIIISYTLIIRTVPDYLNVVSLNCDLSHTLILSYCRAATINQLIAESAENDNR